MKMHSCQTREVFNQASAFENVNLFTCDLALREALVREGGEHAGAALAALGAQLGAAAVLELGRLANAGPTALTAQRSSNARCLRTQAGRYSNYYCANCVQTAHKPGFGWDNAG